MNRTPASALVPHAASRVVLRGELDLLTAPEADRMLRDAAERHPGCDLLIDLREVTFADCAGLRPLVRALRRARQHGGTVTALVGSDRLMRLLSLTRISEVIAVLPASADPDPDRGGAGGGVPGGEGPRGTARLAARPATRTADSGANRPADPE
jgi:anti-sigma B factor antagonist